MFGHNSSPAALAVSPEGSEWSSSMTVWRLLVCLGAPPLLVADMTECMRKAKLPANAVGSLGGPKADGTKV